MFDFQVTLGKNLVQKFRKYDGICLASVVYPYDFLTRESNYTSPNVSR
jgi:hypothetical protein